MCASVKTPRRTRDSASFSEEDFISFVLDWLLLLLV